MTEKTFTKLTQECGTKCAGNTGLLKNLLNFL